jgi:hypothetical protein
LRFRNPNPKGKGKKIMAIYFGGSRSWSLELGIIPQVVQAVLALGQSVHVGCQYGADAHVVQCCLSRPLFLVVFAVAPDPAAAPAHVVAAGAGGARVVYSAGGSESTLIKARYLLRSIAAFQGCESAVFFSPGHGSLAVAREAIKAGLPVFAFGSYPAPIPSSVGFWVESSFMGFFCWQWQVTVIQPALF